MKFYDKYIKKWLSPSTDNGFPVNIVKQEFISPVEVASRTVTQIPTHNAASVAANTSLVPSTWMDTQDPTGIQFTEFDVTLTNDAATSSRLDAYWSNDGTTIHGITTIIAQGTAQRLTNDPNSSIKTKARYLKIVPVNLDTAAAHTMSVNVQTKA